MAVTRFPLRPFALALCWLLTGIAAKAGNPLVTPGSKSFPDVNLVPVGDTVYAFGGTDAIAPKGEKVTSNFNMPYWRVISSKDLVNWTLESELHPEDLYMGKTDQCWAGFGIPRNGKWYWYFSNHNIDTGVAVADSPKGPWRDALKKPLLPESATKTKEYDSSVLIDDDGRAYIVFGINRAGGYKIAELNADMISLRTPPQRIVNNLPKAGDAPFLHKYNGKYYLSSRTEYAVADSVCGPYQFKGNQVASGHGGFFTFNNQWYVNFTSKPSGPAQPQAYRSLAYVHYRADGSIAPMEPLIEKCGVGQYDANWNRIEAEWFFAMPDGPKKTETAAGGFEISNLRNSDYLRFPNISQCPNKASVEFTYSCANSKGGAISIRLGAEKGKEIGRAQFAPTGSWNNYKTVSVPLGGQEGTLNLAFVFEGDSNQELIRVDAFKVAVQSPE